MAVETHTCDPAGDLLLIITREEKQSTAELTADPPVDEENEISEGDVDQQVIDDPESLDGDDEDKPDDRSNLVVYHILVSSKHLALSSVIFKAMLQGKFRESLTLREKGELELVLPDDDPDTLLILLNILHHRTKEVPRLVCLERLTKLAILVDKYQMHESVEVFSDMWIEGLQDDIPKALTADVLPWLCISWVFQKETPFKDVTKILMLEGDEDMGGDALQELPIPDLIISKLAKIRISALTHIFETLTSLVETYQEATRGSCLRDGGNRSHNGSDCDALVLGKLIRGYVKYNFWPVPHAPYTNLSVKGVLEDLQSLKVQTLCEIYSSTHSYKSYREGDHKVIVADSMKKLVSYIEDMMGGLKLNDYKYMAEILLKIQRLSLESDAEKWQQGKATAGI